MNDTTVDSMHLSRRTWIQCFLSCGISAGSGLAVDSLRSQSLFASSPSLLPTSFAAKSSSADLIDTRTEQAIEKGLSWLVSRQNEDGSFGDSDYSRNTGVNAIVGIAMLSEGSVPGRGRLGEALDRLTEFLCSQATSSGLISHPAFQSRGPMYEHGFATLFLAEILGSSRQAGVREILQRAVRTIVDSQNNEGGWRYQPRRDDADVSVTVAQVMSLRAARNAGIHVPNETVEKAVAYLRRSQNADGGFRYMSEETESAFPRSAAAIVALFNAGVVSGPEIDQGLAYLQTFPPTAEAGPLPSHFFYGHYYAVQAMWHAGGVAWETWYRAIRDLLIARQKEDGRWEDLLASDYATAMACIILQVPNDLLPILQR
jgi:hypothetical protein